MDANGNCVKCSSGYYFNSNNICVQTDPNCKVFDTLNKVCTGCYPGFALDSSYKCAKSSASQPLDPNCASFNANGNCVLCSKGSSFNNFGVCASLDPSCLTYNPNNGYCLTCYPGYGLDSTRVTCVVQAAQANPNPYCSKWNGTICLSCATGSYFNFNSICVLTDPNCKTTQNGVCLACYPGYSLDASSSQCVKSTAQSIDPNCAVFNPSGNCIQCSKGSSFNFNGLCVTLDPSCLTYNQNTMSCLTCYPGYGLDASGVTCVVQAAQANTNPYCSNWNGTVCLACAINSYFNINNICVITDPNCKLNQNGVCLACYSGYSLSNSQCVKSAAQSIDPNCASFNSNGNCMLCSKGASFNSLGLCIILDPSCLTYNQANGRCLTCYPGYGLDATGVTCVVQAVQANTNPYCSKWNGNVCLSCATNSYFNSNNICVVSDPNCQASLNGICSQCYSGYDLQSNSCVKSTATNNNPLCFKFNGLTCVQCAVGTYFNSQGICTLVSPLCKTFDTYAGNCLTCFPGYALVGVACVVSANSTTLDPYCKQFQGQLCYLCDDRYFLNKSGLCS